jgi:hypothetical protein
MQTLSRFRAPLLAWTLAFGAGAGCSAQPNDSQPEARAAPAEFADADAFLSALEAADEGLRRLTAGVEYTKIFQPDGEIHRRVGTLYFASDPRSDGEPDRRRFAVQFTEFFRDDRLEEDRQDFAFDGQWLLEKRPKEKEFHLRQVLRPGERADPLKIGEGPFPLPIGQKKADILAEYDATLLPHDDGLAPDAENEEPDQARVLIDWLANCWQVRLTPRPGKDSDFSEIRLWYIRGPGGRLLPRMARTVAATDDPELRGDVSLVRLINLTANEEAKFDDAVFDVRAPEGWQGDVSELPRAPAAPR